MKRLIALNAKLDNAADEHEFNALSEEMAPVIKEVKEVFMVKLEIDASAVEINVNKFSSAIVSRTQKIMKDQKRKQVVFDDISKVVDDLENELVKFKKKQPKKLRTYREVKT